MRIFNIEITYRRGPASSTTLEQIMTAISDFAAKQNAFNAAIGADIDALVTSTNGLTDDVAALNAKIAALQASPGAITPEDQKTLDDLTAAGVALQLKTDTAAAKIAALDAQTPPTPPVA